MSNKLLELAEADPKAAVELLRQLQKKVVIPHAGGQQEIINDKTRFKIVCSGRRFGKTTIAAKKALEKCSEPNQMCWWIAPTYKVVKRGYAEVIRQLPRQLLTHEPPQDSAFDAGRSVKLRFKNGSIMEFYSSERPEGMLGASVDLAVLDEAATMKPTIWDQIVRPTLMDRQGEALMISTPRGRNWFYYLWLKGQSKDNDNYASWRFPTASNPYILESEIDDMKQNMPLITFEQEVLAEFISSAGAVFRFNPEIIVKRVRPSGHVVVGVDLAKSQDFTVLTAARVEDMMPCGFDRFNEIAWKMQRARIRGFVAKLIKAGATSVTLVMDSTGVGDPIVEEIETDGYDVIPINFTKDKQHMVIQLGKDLEDGFVRLDKGEEIAEFENYSYKVTEGGRWTYSAPEGQHDDCVSAKMLQHWGITQEGIPNIVAMAATDDTVDSSIPIDEDKKPYELDENDYSDLVDEAAVVDTGVPEETELIADTAASIMLRAAAWGAREF